MQLLERSPLLALTRSIALITALFTSGCGAGAYVWVDQLPAPRAPAAPESAYLIVSGDLINIRVYDQDTISIRGRVGSDGKIAIPLAGEISAAGQRTSALARLIEARLRPFIVAPSVAVLVEEAQPLKIAILGEVAHPGAFATAPGTVVLQALALAGGLTEYASHDGIFVLREQPAKGVLRIRFTYGDLTRGIGRGPTFPLQSGDTVVVE